MLVRPGFEPMTPRSADRHSPNWANQAAVLPFRVLNKPHLYCCRKHINSYDTNVLKQRLRTLRFCHLHIFIKKILAMFWCIFLSLYFMLYMTGLPLSLWDSEHGHNTVNMLCSLKKKNAILQILPPHNGHLSTRATFFCTKGGPLWRGLNVHKMYEILMY